MATFSQFLSSLDSDAGKRGKQFEHFVKWFLKNDPEWATQVDQIWLWDEYPDSWGRDCGIDLVFKHKNGENWAVQAKCYAPTTQITKAHVDSFISESSRDGIDKRLLIATTDLLAPNAKQVCDSLDKGNIKVTRYLLSHFDESDIEYPASLEDLPKAKPKDKPKPREHQLEAIEAVSSNFKDTDRGQLIMACGTGKTFTTLWIKEKLGAESTLVLLPSLGLLSQTLHEWTLATNEEFQVLCVCSDESVGRGNTDEAVHSIADLAFPVTSNACGIRNFLNRSGNKVIFSTYQSSPLIAEAQEDQSVPYFDLAIADEAHRCAGKVSGDFSSILDAQKIRAKKRLFTTATPRTYSSSVKKAAEDRGVEVVGMDDEVVFGKQLFALNFGEAIKRGLLTDYRVVIIGVDDPTVSAWIENRELLKADSNIEMDAESLAVQIGLLKAIKDYDLHRLISFHSRVSRAEEFSKDIYKVISWIDKKHKPSGELKSDFVSGEMPTDKRRKKLAQLKGLQDTQRGLLTNARCLSEGVDVPSLDGVAFIDPKSSRIDIIQAVGRAIRLSTNKQAGTIILPVFISKSDDPDQALEESNFKPIWDVLNALKAHDDVLADELNQIRTELGHKGGGKVDPDAFSKITIDLPMGIDKSFGDEIRTLLVERSTDSWEYWYGLLISWRQETGKYVPEISDEFRQKKIGVWVGSQRTNYKRGLLDKNRIEKIESLEGWSWDLVEDLWLRGYSAIKFYFNENGSTRVPDKYLTEEGFKLGSWIKTRRLDYKRDNLRDDKIITLEAFPDWSWDPSSDNWIKTYNNIKDLLVTKTLHEIEAGRNDKNLKKYAVWLFAQKRNYLAQANTTEVSQKNYRRLTKKEISLLEGLPKWTWERKKEAWNFNFSILKDYLSQNTFKSINAKTMHQNFSIGRWVTKQRVAIKTGRLEPWKIKLLDSVNWVANPFESKWNETYVLLNEYVTETGSAIVPQSILYKNKQLGVWVSSQRQDYKTKILSSDRVKKLEMLRGWAWEASDMAAHSISKGGLSSSKLKKAKKT